MEPVTLPHVESEWCIAEGLVSLDEETCCFLPPIEDGVAPRLLVYLHGITPPTKESPNKTLVQTSVVEACGRAGVFGLVPRGRRHIGPPHARDWWAWPTTPEVYAELAAEIVARILDAKSRLETAIGARFARTYLAGGSNGATFVTALALHGDLERFGLHVDGLGAMTGGSAAGHDAASLRGLRPIPTHIGYGSEDEPVQKNAVNLHAVLEEAGWPVSIAVHPFPHGSRPQYLDDAFAFWPR